MITEVELTVAEAAERLGVIPRRVRALIESGHLPARRQGPLWLTTDEAVATYRRSAPGRGRPMRQLTAWARLRELAIAGSPPNPETVLPILRARAARRRLALPTLVADRLGTPPGTLPGGAAAARTTPVDGVIDLYSTTPVAQRLIDRLTLTPDPTGRLALHIVEAGDLPTLNEREQLLLAWCDLADRADPAADVPLEALWPAAITGPHLADVTVDTGVPYRNLRNVIDWTARHPRFAHRAIVDCPAPTGSAGIDSLLAGIAETIADDHHLSRPRWTAGIPPARLEVGGLIDLTGPRGHEVPAPLAARGLGFTRETFWRER